MPHFQEHIFPIQDKLNLKVIILREILTTIFLILITLFFFLLLHSLLIPITNPKNNINPITNIQRKTFINKYYSLNTLKIFISLYALPSKMNTIYLLREILSAYTKIKYFLLCTHFVIKIKSLCVYSLSVMHYVKLNILAYHCFHYLW